MVKFEIDGAVLTCETKPDLFSPKNLDTGTRMLLESVIKLSGSYTNVLDWGCGWGAIGLTLAELQPESRVTAVDSDIAAVSTATANAENNRIHNLKVVASHGFDQLDQDQKFDIIVSNPPTHRGREVLEQMVVESYQHLTASGRLVVVVEARLKPWVARAIKSSFGDYKILKRGPKHVVLTGRKVLQ